MNNWFQSLCGKITKHKWRRITAKTKPTDKIRREGKEWKT